MKYYFLLFFLVALVNAVPPPRDINEAKALMAEVEKAFWSSVNSFRLYGDDNLSSELFLREELRQFYPRMLQFDYENFDDPQLKRQFQLLLRGNKFPKIDFKLKKAVHSIRTVARTKWSCEDFRNPTQLGKCSKPIAYVPHIKTVTASSDNLEELEYYWLQWRDKMPREVKDSLLTIIEYYREAANIASRQTNTTVKPSDIWYDGYEDTKFLDELTELMERILPMYKELHAHIRQVLREKYGNHIIGDRGLIPYQLIEQVRLQAWKKTTVLQNPFDDKKLPNLQAEMDSSGYTPRKIVEKSAEFFSDIGIGNLTNEFWVNNIREMKSSGADCKSIIFDYGEVDLEYCNKSHFKKLLQTHSDMTEIQYALIKNKLPVGLNKEAMPGFSDALGEAILLSASTPHHMKEHLNILGDLQYDDELSLNRLYRQGVHTLIQMPVYYVHEKLWVDMLNGDIQPEEYNCHYWKLMAKWAGIGPPTRRTKDTWDMSYRFYTGVIEATRHTRKLVGEMLGYQIYRALCTVSGEFVRGSAYKLLQTCDFAKNKEAGRFLKEMMSKGATQSWRETIKPLTAGNINFIGATAFIEYYEPMNLWQEEDNREKNLFVGWEEYPQCFSS